MSYKPFKMKGHTLPGISQKKADKTADGRPGSSAFQKKEGDKKDKTISFKKSLKKGYTKDAEGNVLYRGNYVPSYRLKDAYETTSSTGGVVSNLPKTTKMDKEYKVVDKKGGSGSPSKMKRKTQVDGEQVTASKASGGMFMKKMPKKKVKAVDKYSKVSGLQITSGGKEVRQSMAGPAGKTLVNKQTNREIDRDYRAANQPKAKMSEDMPKGKKKRRTKRFERKAMKS